MTNESVFSSTRQAHSIVNRIITFFNIYMFNKFALSLILADSQIIQLHTKETIVKALQEVST